MRSFRNPLKRPLSRLPGAARLARQYVRDAVRLAQVLNEMHDDQWGRALCRGIQGGLIGDDCVFSYGFTNESFNEGGGAGIFRVVMA